MCIIVTLLHTLFSLFRPRLRVPSCSRESFGTTLRVIFLLLAGVMCTGCVCWETWGHKIRRYVSENKWIAERILCNNTRPATSHHLPVSLFSLLKNPLSTHTSIREPELGYEATGEEREKEEQIAVGDNKRPKGERLVRTAAMMCRSGLLPGTSRKTRASLPSADRTAGDSSSNSRSEQEQSTSAGRCRRS